MCGTLNMLAQVIDLTHPSKAVSFDLWLEKDEYIYKKDSDIYMTHVWHFWHACAVVRFDAQVKRDLYISEKTYKRDLYGFDAHVKRDLYVSRETCNRDQYGFDTQVKRDLYISEEAYKRDL